MSQLLREAGAGGLAPCAIVMTLSAFTAGACVFILYGILRLLAPVPNSYALAISGLAWLVCMARTWQELAQARAKWPNTNTSTSLFKVYQILPVGMCVLLALMTGHFDAPEVAWAVVCMEVIVSLLFVSYVFLGLTLRVKFPRSAYISLLLAIASAAWSCSKIPRL